MSKLVTEISTAFAQLQDALIDKGLLIDANPLFKNESQHGTSLSWSRGANLSYLFGDYTTLEHYLETLKRRDFNFVFSDGAVLQIYYLIEDDEVSKHRLCYLPCPFNYVKSEWEGYTIDEVIDLLDFESLKPNLRMNSPLRFDFDKNFTDEKHAHSHVTFNKDTCRVPAYGAVSLGHFARFVIRYFYETEFNIESDLSKLRPMIYTRTLSTPVAHEMHFDTSASYR